MRWIVEIIVVPILLLLAGGAFSWFIKSRTEELREIQTKLREDRRIIYDRIIEPYIKLFGDLKGKGPGEAIKKITSYDYKKSVFELSLFGSDEVVLAYNNLMQHSYKAEATGNQNPKEMMRLFGKLLLEIRKSHGNKRTRLDEIDMFRAIIKDIEKLENK